MNVDKTKIFIGYVVVKSTIYIAQRKEDIQLALDLFVSNDYSQSLEMFLSIVGDTMEYVININI